MKDIFLVNYSVKGIKTYERTQLKLTPIYMDGKGKYVKKEKDVKSKKEQYRVTSKNNQSKVIYCFDCDEYCLGITSQTYIDYTSHTL